MRLHRFVVAISLFLLLAASCGGGGTEEATPTPTCTTVTPGPDGSPTPTPTPCLVGATGAPPTAEPTGFTGELWEGTYSGSVTWDCGPIGQRSGTLAGDFTITVDADGTATMIDDHTVTGSCQGPGGSLTTPLTMIGERTESGFDFPSFLGTSSSLFIAVSGDQGTGTFTGPAPGNAIAEVTLEMERVESAVG